MICPEKPKCSNASHSDVDAAMFCLSCNKFMCESCEKFHNGLLSDHRPVHISDLPPGSTIITDRCNDPNHNNYPLQYYCKDHNVPCCAVCLCVKESVGKHSKCQTVPLKDMEHHMKSTLSDVIKKLEDSIISTESSLKKIKNSQDENEKAKNEVMNQIKTNFALIREAVDVREKELLANVEKLWGNESSCDKLIEAGTEHPEKAKQIVEAAKKVEQHWDTNHLPKMAHHYSVTINKVKELMEFNNEVDETLKEDLKVKFKPDKEGIDAFIKEIKNFGNVFIKPKIAKFTVSMKESPNNSYVLEGPNKSIIKKINNDTVWNCTAIGNNTLPPNSIIKWGAKMVSTKNKWFMIGIAPSDIDQKSANNYKKCGWHLFCCNLTLYSGPPHNYSNKQYRQDKKPGDGDVVGVIVDTKIGEISFSVNGNDLGVAYSEIPLDKPLVPVIEFYHTNDSVEIISN